MRRMSVAAAQASERNKRNIVQEWTTEIQSIVEASAKELAAIQQEQMRLLTQLLRERTDTGEEPAAV